jgi:hypothetical protein
MMGVWRGGGGDVDSINSDGTVKVSQTSQNGEYLMMGVWCGVVGRWGRCRQYY